MPTFVLRFAQGLDNFGEDQYETLRTDALRTRTTLEFVAGLDGSNDAASRLLEELDDFIAVMDDLLWDVTQALTNQEALTIADGLGSPATLAMANQVDAAVIGQCGLPSTLVPNDQAPVTLPLPVVPGPNEPDTETDPIDPESELYALGLVVGTLFELTLDDSQVMCLGGELAEVVDRSDATSNSAQYLSQFQEAFDACGIDFQVPTD